jgi:hypothetical protein
MKEYQLASGKDASVTGTSVQLDTGDMKELAIQISFSSASLNGTLQLQASCDNATYFDISDSGASYTVSSGAGHMFNVSGAGYRYIRAKWTPSSGTGTWTALATLKEVTIKGA